MQLEQDRRAVKKLGGVCEFCGTEFARAGMARHLAKCRPPGSDQAYHLFVESTYWPDFWLHIEARNSASLAHLDALLRNVWLECCGHLSAFEIGGVRYESRPFDGGWGPKAKTMKAKIGSVLRPGSTFSYVYDYGSSTVLQGKCIGLVGTSPKGARLRVVAQNLMPPLPCACGEPATQLDTWTDLGALCAACAKREIDEGADEDGFLPAVNSPRMGVCGYDG